MLSRCMEAILCIISVPDPHRQKPRLHGTKYKIVDVKMYMYRCIGHAGLTCMVQLLFFCTLCCTSLKYCLLAKIHCDSDNCSQLIKLCRAQSSKVFYTVMVNCAACSIKFLEHLMIQADLRTMKMHV